MLQNNHMIDEPIESLSDKEHILVTEITVICNTCGSTSDITGIPVNPRLNVIRRNLKRAMLYMA